MPKISEARTSSPGAVQVTDSTAVAVAEVRKTFKLRHTHSIKESVVAMVRGKTISSTFDALSGVDFAIESGESVALLGFNGSGKSTLLKLISGVLRPDAGTIRIRGRIAGLIEVGAGFHPDLSGRENVYLNAAILGMTKDEIDARFDDIVAFSEIEKFIDTEVKHYSSGMFLRLAFSVAVHTEVDILLVDEILSVGDEPFQRKCLDRIRELQAVGTTLVVVSHDLDMVSKLCDRGILLREGKVVFDGEAKHAVEQMRGSAPTFVDVPASRAFFDEVEWAAAAGIAEGFEVGDRREFRPVEEITRAELAELLHRFEGSAAFEVPATPTFADVPATHPRATEIEWFAATGLAPAGVADLGPDHTVDRAEFAALLHRHAGEPAHDLPRKPTFVDVPLDHPQLTAIEWLASTGISAGWQAPRGTMEFRPETPLTREATVVFLHRYREWHPER
ncbi:ATP-binding cassette domain-containing protein [Aeromicrobium alkaliterrae]|uniref:ABC transporter ATP-binding protein n=1 Tax=Aeromicrobium alkaliterrae TaxID=302168 RepID=A0ABN2JGI4_9ACTN